MPSVIFIVSHLLIITTIAILTAKSSAMSQLSYSAATMLTPKADSLSPGSSLATAAAADYPSVEEKRDHLNSSNINSFSYPAMWQGSYGGISTSMSASYGVNSATNYDITHDEEEEDEEEDYDDDEDYDNEFDGNDYGQDEMPPAAAMSESLMIALGMDVTNRPKVESDWVPPSNFGLDYSARKLYMLQMNVGVRHSFLFDNYILIINLHIINIMCSQQLFQPNSTAAPSAESKQHSSQLRMSSTSSSLHDCNWSIF